MLRSIKFAAVCFGLALLLLTGGLAKASWVTLPSGSKTMPQDAMVAGRYSDGTPIYACQAYFIDGLHSGWTMAGKGNCSIGWGGAERTVTSYSVWQNDWIPASGGAIPALALPLGYEYHPAPPSPVLTIDPGTTDVRYACKANVLDGNGTVEAVTSGKVGPDLGGCLFGWGGLEIHQPNYQILVDHAFVSYQDDKYTAEPSSTGFYQLVAMSQSTPIPYDAVLSGHEANGMPLYLCNTYYTDGVQIGKTRSDYGSCDISYGGGEYWEYNYNVLVPYWTNHSNGEFPYRTPVDDNSNYETAIASGVENGVPQYLCRGSVAGSSAIFTGRVRQNLGYCSIAYNGKEYGVTTYQVLTDRYQMWETVVR